MPRRLSAHYAYIYAHFSLFDVFTVALPVTPGVLAGGAQLRRSPLQHPPVRFARSKLRLVREVSPFNSKFTARGSLTWIQSGTPSKLAEGDFFRQFWQGGALLRWSPPQHLSVQFAHGKLHLVGEVSPSIVSLP